LVVLAVMCCTGDVLFQLASGVLGFLTSAGAVGLATLVWLSIADVH
jgi:hypothetical protein